MLLIVHQVARAYWRGCLFKDSPLDNPSQHTGLFSRPHKAIFQRDFRHVSERHNDAHNIAHNQFIRLPARFIRARQAFCYRQ